MVTYESNIVLHGHLRVKYLTPWSHTSQMFFSMGTYELNIVLRSRLRVKYFIPWSLMSQILECKSFMSQILYSMVTKLNT